MSWRNGVVDVKVGVFFGPDDKENAQRLFEAIRSEGIPVRAYKFSPRWEDTDPEEMRFNLDDLLHLVLVVNRAGSQQPWYEFLAGFAYGRSLGVSIRATSNREIPRYIDDSTVFASDGALVDHVIEEYAVRINRLRIDQAREEIVQRGFSITEDAFASAVLDGNREMSELFLTLGMSPDSTDTNGVPLLNIAVRNGQGEIARMLVDKGTSVNMVSAESGNSALMEGAGRGETDICRLLVDCGASLDTQSKNGQTALMLAVAEGHVETALMLLEKGSDPCIVDKLGMSALKYARLFGHERLLEAIGTQC